MRLINTWEEFKDHFSLTYTDLEIERLWPHIETATESYLEPLVGEELLAEVMAYANPEGSGSGSGSGSDTEEMEALLMKMRRPVAFLAIHIGLPYLEVRIGNEGIYQMGNDNSAQPIFSSQREDIREQSLRDGLNALEQLLRYLEKKKEVFTTWATSEARTWSRAHILRDAVEFTEHWGAMDNSRVTYRALRHRMVDVEETIVRPMLGDALMDALLAALKNGTETAAHKRLLVHLRPLVAQWTAAKAMPMLRMSIGAFGIYTVQIEKAQRNVLQKLGVKEAEVMREAERLMADAKWRLTEVERTLEEYAADYPLHAGSDADTAAEDVAAKEAFGEERKGFGVQYF